MKNQTKSIRTTYRSKIKEILAYRKFHTLKDTGKKFHITGERVRQIEMIKHRRRCAVHNRYFYNKCSYCLAMSYKKMLSFMKYESVEKEALKESRNKKRDYLSVQRKIYLIDILYNKFSNSYSQIAVKLNRDRSSIINLSKKI